MTRFLHHITSISCNIFDCLQEWRLGIKTKGLIRESIHIDDNHPYCPASYYAFYSLMDKIDIDFSKATFIDYGCGKGRIVCAASKYTFKNVIGVELSELFANESKANLLRMKNIKTNNVEIANTSAVDFELPEDNLVLFFYNPFGETVLSTVLQKIKTVTSKSNKLIYIVS